MPPSGSVPGYGDTARHSGQGHRQGCLFRSCKPVRVAKGYGPTEMDVKGRAQNDKTRALCALRHVVILCSNTSISVGP